MGAWLESAPTTGQRASSSAKVDLVTIEQVGNRYTFRDLYIDVIVPLDGRHYRLLDLDEFADAIDQGSLSVSEAVDALRRWQRFLDRHLHAERAPTGAWSDFPPAAILALREMPPFTNAVRWDASFDA